MKILDERQRHGWPERQEMTMKKNLMKLNWCYQVDDESLL